MLPKPPTNPGITIKKIMIRAWADIISEVGNWTLDIQGPKTSSQTVRDTFASYGSHGY